MFFLNLLGGARLSSEEGPVTGAAVQRHRLGLLALLGAGHPDGLSRDKLLAFLWPDRDTEHARGLLKQAVHALRRVLGEEAILAAGDVLRLNPEVVTSDVAAFEAALASGDAARAAALYAGPFLDGFFLSNAAEFEDWVERERDQLAMAYARALEALAEAAGRERDLLGAVEWWKARAVQDPCDSRVALRLMQALAASGNRAGALQHAAVHERLLQQDFGVGSPPELCAAVEALRSPSGTPERMSRAPALLDAEAPPPADSRTEPELRPRAPPSEAGPRERRAEDQAEKNHAVVDPPVPAGRTRPRRAAMALAITIAIGSLLSVGWSVLTIRSSLGPQDSAGGTGESPPASGPAPAGTALPPRALAVLPFTNVSLDPQEEYFSDGLTDELINTLSQVHALRVVARTSAFAFKGEGRDVRDIGRTLGVGTVLEGSVLKNGDRIRVTAQLISAADGFHLWSESYEREGTDVFAIRSDLALRITAALEAALTPVERGRLAHRATESPEAYRLYLKGRHFWYQRTSGGFARAFDYFQRAIAADSLYARAHAGLATVYLLQGLSGDLSAEQAGERTRAAALRALALDDELAEAHAALGAYYEAYAWNEAAAEREWLRAIELDPNDPTVRHFYGNLLAARGHFDEAIAQKSKAVELDPLSPVFSEVLGNTLRRAGRPAEALQALRNAIELDSTYWRAYDMLGATYEMMGSFEEAVRAHRRAVEFAGVDANVDTRFARIGLARALALAGQQADARRMLVEFETEAERTGFHRAHVATVFLALDDVEGALEWLEQSDRERNPELRARALAVLKDPLFAGLQHDPRFRDLLRRIGFPP
jgi:TolB-like protein/DNA-binding SARP family transcriptional activator/Tfp pilus assembly protein PilF